VELMTEARIMKRFAGAALAGLMAALTATGAAADAYEAMFAVYGIPMSDTLQEADRAVAAGDYERAQDLLAPLADGGDADAQVMLGLMYMNEQVAEVRDGHPLVAKFLICAAYKQGQVLAQEIATGGACD
jgi:TPR repeat protein